MRPVPPTQRLLKGSLAALLVPHRPEPGFKGERGTPAFGLFVRQDTEWWWWSFHFDCGKRRHHSRFARPAAPASRMPYLSSVSCDARIPQIAHVDGDVRTRGDFIEPQVNHRIGGFDEHVIGRAAIGVRSVLIVSQNLRGT